MISFSVLPTFPWRTCVYMYLCMLPWLPVHRSLMKLKYSFKVLNNDLLMSETQQLIILVENSCIIFILFLCYIQQLLVLVAIVVVLHSS